MHARELTELAAVIVGEAAYFLRPGQTLSDRAIKAYWTSSKCLQDRWARAFKRHHRALDHATPAQLRAAWKTIRPTIDEIFCSELLTRVWCAVLHQRDAVTGESQYGPIARSVWLGHAEARHRALNLMVYGKGFGVAEGMRMNRLRRRCEQWIDLLLGALKSRCDISEFAIDHKRADRFAVDLDYQGQDVSVSPAWQWIRASLRTSFVDLSGEPAANADLNRHIASSVLASFCTPQHELYGDLQSAWIERMHAANQDTQGAVNESLFEGMRRREKPLRTQHRFDSPSSGPRTPRF